MEIEIENTMTLEKLCETEEKPKYQYKFKTLEK